MRPSTRVLLLAPLLGLLAACASPGPGARAELKLGARAAGKELWREAALRFEKAVALEPGNARAWNNLAVAYESLGRFDEAREAYRRALQAAPGAGPIRSNFERFRKRHGDGPAAPEPPP